MFHVKLIGTKGVFGLVSLVMAFGIGAVVSLSRQDMGELPPRYVATEPEIRFPSASTSASEVSASLASAIASATTKIECTSDSSGEVTCTSIPVTIATVPR